MRKNIAKKFIAALSAIMVLLTVMPFFTVTASAKENLSVGWSGDPNDSVFMDNADLFSDSEERELNNAVRDMSEKLEMNIIVLAAGPSYRMSDSNTVSFCENKIEEIFGLYSDSVFFFMDFTGKKPAYDYICTSGQAKMDYEGRIDTIFDRFYNLMPSSSVTAFSDYSDDIYKAVKLFLSMLSEYHGSKSYYKDSDDGTYYYYENDKLVITTSKPFRERLKALIWAVPVGLLVGLIFFFIVKMRYRFKKSLNSMNYVSQQETAFTVRSDQFLRAHTSKVRIETNSGGGSHRSGGGSHHSSFGGGGRHR